MRIVVAISAALLFLYSCTKEKVDGFDGKIQYAQDFKIDPATGDTVFMICMPSGFTPNGDGVDDCYRVYVSGYDAAHFVMQIFSRENNLIYYSEDANTCFDGASQGMANINGTTVYSVEVEVTDTLGEAHHYTYDIAQFR